MTRKALEDICAQAASRWKIIDTLVIHRVGRLVPGDRIVLVTQFKDTGSIFGSNAAQAVDPKEVLVDVIDVVLAYPGKSDGFNQLPKDGMPTVVTAVDGTPGIQVPATKPPKTTEFATIKAGSGSVVRKGKTVVLQFTLWTWPDKVGAAPDNSTLTTWTDKVPRALKMTNIDDGGGLPKGLTDALIGQKIGSQVLVVIPPGTDDFPASALANDALPGVTETSTLIWVVDLLGIQK
jgi:peptidylprolyl isomerase